MTAFDAGGAAAGTTTTCSATGDPAAVCTLSNLDFGFEEPCLDPEGDRICNESCADDRDGDGRADCEDFDPQGYLYCEGTGEILTGGLIDVTGPGAVTILADGSLGSYEFLTDGTPGLDTLVVTPPEGFPQSETCLDQGILDPTGLPAPVTLGAGRARGLFRARILRARATR